jgi:hypothetical protein
VKQEMDPDVTGASVGTENGYVALAAGEPLPMTQPSDTNHIQFHSGFLGSRTTIVLIAPS